MPFATARAVSLHGALGHLIDVQADVSPGQVLTTVVGRADASLHESRDRCRMAIINSELVWPATKRNRAIIRHVAGLQGGESGRRAQKEPRAAVGENMCDLRALEQRVDRHVDQPRARCRQRQKTSELAFRRPTGDPRALLRHLSREP